MCSISYLNNLVKVVFMESKNTLWLVMGLIVVLVGAFVVWQYVLPGMAAGQVDAKKNEAKDLYFKTLAIGKDADSYYYSYEEDMSGYIVKTTLLKNGPRYEAIIETPLTKREIFYMENDTYLCVNFNGFNECSSVGNNTELRSYLKGIKGYFFSNARFNDDNDTISFLLEKNALTFQSYEKSSVNGKECNNIKYIVNYSALSLSDSAKLGITSSSPTEVLGEICYDQKANEVYVKSFTYKRLGKQQFTKWKLLGSDWKYSTQIEFNRNVTNESAVSLLYAGVEVQNEFISCLEKGGVQADACVFSFAINYEYPQVCKYAGTKADFCTLNFALFDRNVAMCEQISDSKVKDDCRIEIAGKSKNETICGMLNDKSRTQYCMDVVSGKITPVKVSNETIEEISVPELPEDNSSMTNRSEEETNALIDIFTQMEHGEKENKTNTTNSSS